MDGLSLGLRPLQFASSHKLVVWKKEPGIVDFKTEGGATEARNPRNHRSCAVRHAKDEIQDFARKWQLGSTWKLSGVG